ncbi:hypothetical protein RQP55_08575 [Novosphingobium sp. APW14]|uniref:DUF6602 domain-containing protein n=1 Tax=Novosphingobium sp. APW14 TaxID=3077237 RepID=UPI0028DF7B8F|nr:DUF6602 domain-containing protein [Novosphingobium sp. APW14]MDT9013476.1 hypothetical protein [Novosphingobium sp. APW14]
MPNPHVLQRLTGLQAILNGIYQSSVGLSSATIGQERAAFIDEFLAKVLPPIYRFGTGDATDASGAKSGQLDVVVEYPFAPSLPTVGAGQTRLYLAEAAAAVVEVKSNLANQWTDAVNTANALATLHRSFGASMSFGNGPASQIPLFAVGYTGWKNISTLQNNLNACPNIMGALVIDAGLYASRSGLVAQGPWALWGLIADLHFITNSLQSASTDPLAYAL